MQLLMSSVAPQIGRVMNRAMLGWVMSVMIVGKNAVRDFNALTKKLSINVLKFLPSMTLSFTMIAVAILVEPLSKIGDIESFLLILTFQ
jgi:hypothetical protein